MEYTGNEKKILRGIYILSGVVFLLIVILSRMPKAETMPEFVKVLPVLNAVLNATCFFLSTIFLLSYVTFHAFGVETKFPADNPIRPFYLTLLISHIILAAIVLPLVLVSFYFGLTGKIARHKKLTRFSFPIWLYVTITGVVVYLMISPYYGF